LTYKEEKKLYYKKKRKKNTAMEDLEQRRKLVKRESERRIACFLFISNLEKTSQACLPCLFSFIMSLQQHILQKKGELLTVF
jgi:hypothetical protein